MPTPVHDALADFSHLTPDHVIEQVESVLGIRCGNLCRQLTSYINRVYEVQTEDGAWVIIKFYRPGRWSREALEDELEFLLELSAEEIPAVAPLTRRGEALHQDPHGVFFSLFPKIGGRPLVEPSHARWVEIGRLLARVHQIGALHPPRKRVRLHPEWITVEHVEAILAADFPYDSLRDDYADIADDLITLIAPLFDGVDMLRIHGDCHGQNVLERPDEPLRLIDFDDMATGPAVQDLWMLLPDRADRCPREIAALADGYETFRPFPWAEIKLIEPLRAMRYIHFTAWCARQKKDGGFNRLAPDWGTESYWKKEIDDLRRQISVISGS